MDQIFLEIHSVGNTTYPLSEDCQKLLIINEIYKKMAQGKRFCRIYIAKSSWNMQKKQSFRLKWVEMEDEKKCFCTLNVEWNRKYWREIKSMRKEKCWFRVYFPLFFFFFTLIKKRRSRKKMLLLLFIFILWKMGGFLCRYQYVRPLTAI